MIKRIGKVFLGIILLLAIGTAIFIYKSMPTYDGEINLKELSKTVDVYYDTYGIPHIYAENKKDAFRSLGYVHAQDRLWQMEIIRRIAAGGLSEVFGEEVLRTDKFFIALGIDEASTKTVSELDMNSESVQLSIAYLDGINQFVIEGPTPIEFYLTGIDKTEFTLKDIHNVLGYMAFSFAQAHKTDPFLTNLKEKLGMAYLEDLEIDIEPTSTLIKNYPKTTDTVQNTLISSVTKTLKSLRIPLFEGSNSWVLSPEKTKSGKVIFANDPHIGFSSPSVWYEAHIVTPTYEKYGYHLAGVPFPVLGHDRKLAYGMTMFENDDVDFYFEETHSTDSTRYKTETGWDSYEYKTKIIKIKGGDDVTFNFKKTKRGPVLNGIADQVTNERPVSMWWTYTANENEVIEALHAMSTASGIEDFEKALPKIHAPGLNIMYGDAAGNVAWWATAKLHKVPDSVHTKFIQTSATAYPANKTYLNFSENPHAINPPWKYVYSANNQPDSINGKLYPGYYLSENRAKRIVALLEPKNDWDSAEVRSMITDITSAVNPDILTDLINALNIETLSSEDLELLDLMKAWKGDYPLTSVTATVFHRWVFWVLRNAFSDEMGHKTFEDFLSTHMSKRVIAPMADNPASIWWDDIRTKGIKESQGDIVQKSFTQAIVSLQRDFGSDFKDWTWDKVHTIEHEHPIGQVAALRSFFNVGPFPVHGSREVINNLGFGYNSGGYYKVGSGPSTRRVIDFSNIENSVSILPTGQSGNPFSKHYKDQAEMYINGEFRRMMINEEEIQQSETLLTLRPVQ